MKTLLMTGVAAVTLAVASPAFSKCADTITTARETLAKNESFGRAHAAGRVDQNRYRQLFDAATIFSRAGLESRCEDVVAGIQELAKNDTGDGDASMRRDAKEMKPGAKSSATEKREDAEKRAEARRRAEREKVMARLKAASAVKDATMSIDVLIGKDVRNMQNKDLGEVEDVVVKNGSVQHVIVASGGLLGVGTTYYRIPWEQIRITADRETVVIDADAKTFEAMGKVKLEEGEWIDA